MDSSANFDLVTRTEFESEIRRLRKWNAFYLFVVIVGAFLLGGSWAMSEANKATRNVSVRREGEMLRISSSWDGPYTVIGLLATGDFGGEKRYATFPTPLTIIDSGGAYVPLKGLSWVDVQGEKADPPTGRIKCLVIYPDPISERTQ